ncbi:hypothetical protein OG828_34895 [Streptomyces sp. NBC_00457]|uniref:hypothetical protein n=1 Tax=Streptomyces sp. NBC_00457 TaxID=2975748 RepID=UPI002E1C140F
MDADLEEERSWPSRWPRRIRIAWRQVAVQLLFVIAVTAFVLALFSCGADW